MALQGAWLTRRRIWNLSTLSCPLCSVHLLLSSSTVSWVFVFVHSYLYLSIHVCICEFVFVSHALWYSDTFSSAIFSVKFFLPSSCGHFWLWCWFQMCCCTPVRISHNRERDSSATYHMPNYLWQICPLWSFLWQIIFAHCDLSCSRSYFPTVIFPVADHICPPCSCSLVLLTRFQPRHFGPKRMKLNLTIKHGSLIYTFKHIFIRWTPMTVC